MTFHIITLFPRAFESYLGESIIKRAIEDGKIAFKFYNPRDFADDKRRRIDRPPYGGGPGMVIQALPVIRAVKDATNKIKNRRSKCKIIWLSPDGKQFTNEYAEAIAGRFKDIVLICGRYEGIDARAREALKAEKVSVGPYVLTGGELPALVVADVISRRLPGVLGGQDSLEERRIASSDVYTRPEVFQWNGKKYRVPKILLSGHHKKIEDWRKSRSSR